MKKLVIASIVTVLASPVLAGSLAEPVIEPMIAPPPVQVIAAPVQDWSGFYVGGQLGYGDVSSSDNSLDGGDMIGGVHGGYNMDLGRYVIGAEVDYDGGSVDLANGAGTLDSIARLKLRGGIDLGRTLLYGTAGVAHAQADIGGVSQSDTGFVGGVGLNYAVNDNWTAGTEVLIHKFDDFGGSGVDLDTTTATARVSYRF